MELELVAPAPNKTYLVASQSAVEVPAGQSFVLRELVYTIPGGEAQSCSPYKLCALADGKPVACTETKYVYTKSTRHFAVLPSGTKLSASMVVEVSNFGTPPQKCKNYLLLNGHLMKN
jgi:hypothetical protein